MQASVIGESASVDFYFPNTSSLYCSSGARVITDGIEYPKGCPGFSGVSIDIGEGTLLVGHTHSLWTTESFNGFKLEITNFVFGSANYLGGSMGVTGLSIVDGNLWVNFAGQGSGIAEFSFDTAAVPVPATLALFGLGLAGLGFARRRKQ